MQRGSHLAVASGLRVEKLHLTPPHVQLGPALREGDTNWRELGERRSVPLLPSKLDERPLRSVLLSTVSGERNVGTGM